MSSRISIFFGDRRVIRIRSVEFGMMNRLKSANSNYGVSQETIAGNGNHISVLYADHLFHFHLYLRVLRILRNFGEKSKEKTIPHLYERKNALNYIPQKI